MYNYLESFSEFATYRFSLWVDNLLSLSSFYNEFIWKELKVDSAKLKAKCYR